MSTHSFSYQTFFQHQRCARFILGYSGEQHIPWSLQIDIQNDNTKDSLIKMMNIFILSIHVCPKFWKLEAQKASIVPGTVPITGTVFPSLGILTIWLKIRTLFCFKLQDLFLSHSEVLYEYSPPGQAGFTV